MKRNSKLTIINVVGARPNFVKIAPLMAEYKNHVGIKPILVYTGQHYDIKMSRHFFDQLEIPRPDVNLEVGSATHAIQTAEIMKGFEPVLLKYKPDMVLVVGDVNSALASALVAAKLGVKVVHVEAGLRSFDRRMPEEINRVLTDAISDYLFVTEPSGLKNLKKESIPDARVFYVGNVMIDALKRYLQKANRSKILAQLGLRSQRYALVTLHRPSNVDDLEVLRRLLEVIREIARELPVIFLAHPRTQKNIMAFGLGGKISEMARIHDGASNGGLRVLDPISYLDFLKLMASAKVVLTDSGGIQEETTVLKVPCLTLRKNTERPITLEVGTNLLVGTDPQQIIKGFDRVMKTSDIKCALPDLWDGKAARRVITTLLTMKHNEPSDRRMQLTHQ